MKDLRELRRLDSAWGNFLPMATISKMEVDERGIPVVWVKVMGSSYVCHPRTGQAVPIVDRVRYVRNCNAYPIAPSGQPMTFLPVYHAAVEFFKCDKLTHVALIRDNYTLGQLQSGFGPNRMRVEDGRTLAEVWGSNQVEIEVIDAQQKPIIADSAFAELEVHSHLFWSSHQERDFNQLLQNIAWVGVSQLLEGSDDEKDSLGDYRATNYRIVTNRDYATIDHADTDVHLLDEQIIILIQNDVVMELGKVQKLLSQPPWLKF